MESDWKRVCKHLARNWKSLAVWTVIQLSVYAAAFFGFQSVLRQHGVEANKASTLAGTLAFLCGACVWTIQSWIEVKKEKNPNESDDGNDAGSGRAIGAGSSTADERDS